MSEVIKLHEDRVIYTPSPAEEAERAVNYVWQAANDLLKIDPNDLADANAEGMILDAKRLMLIAAGRAWNAKQGRLRPCRTLVDGGDHE